MTADDRAWADMTPGGRGRARPGPLDHLPIVPPERMREFAGQWRRRPALRALIGAAGRLGEERCNRSPTARALWELSQSDAWIGDRFPHTADFRALGMPLRAPA